MEKWSNIKHLASTGSRIVFCFFLTDSTIGQLVIVGSIFRCPEIDSYYEGNHMVGLEVSSYISGGDASVWLYMRYWGGRT